MLCEIFFLFFFFFYFVIFFVGMVVMHILVRTLHVPLNIYFLACHVVSR